MNSPKKKKNKRRFTVIMSALLTVSVVGVVKEKTNNAVDKIAYEERIETAFGEQNTSSST